MAGEERAARLDTERRRAEGLRVAALFAGRTVAGEIDQRWRILQTGADNSFLRDAIGHLQAPDRPGDPGKLRGWLKDRPKWRELQTWLKARHAEFARASRAVAWFVTDAEGAMLARSPESDIIGRDYAYRDYFHGKGQDLTPGESKGVKPIHQVNRSIFFESTATHTLMVTFTAPIWSDEAKQRGVLGILGMSVEVGAFSGLQLGLGEDQVAVLADTGTEWIEGQPHEGLILHHPRLAEILSKGAAGRPGDHVIFRLPQQRVESLKQLKKARLRQEAAADLPGGSQQADQKRQRISRQLDSVYHDPVQSDYSGTWIAAFEPVIVRGWAAHERDTGWVVIVQEHQDTVGAR